MRQKAAGLLARIWPVLLLLGLVPQFVRLMPRIPEAFAPLAARERIESGNPILYEALARLRSALKSAPAPGGQRAVLLAWHVPGDRDELLTFVKYRAAYELFPVRVEFVPLAQAPSLGPVVQMDPPAGGFPAAVGRGEVEWAAVGASSSPAGSAVYRLDGRENGKIRLVRSAPQPVPSVRTAPGRGWFWPLGLGTLLIAGFLFCKSSGLGNFLGSETPVRLAGYFLSGTGVAVFLMMAGGLAGLRWNFPLLAGAVLGIPLLAALLLPKRVRIPPAPAGGAAASRTDWPGVLLIVAGALFAFTQSALPISAWANWDAWAIWDLKARACWFAGGVPYSYLADPRLGHSHPEYPLGLPLLHAYLGNWAGGMDTRLLRLLSPFFYLVTLAVFSGLLKELGVARWRLRIAGMLALVPQVLYQASSGHADLPLAAVMAACLLATVRAIRGAAPLWAVAWLGGMAASIKNEGAIWALACLAVAWLGLRGKPGNLARGMGAVLLLLCLALPWAVASRQLGLRATDLRWDASWIVPKVPERLGMVMRGFLLETLGPGATEDGILESAAAPLRELGAHILGAWLFFWHVVAFALVLGWRRLKSPPQSAVAKVLAIQLAGILAAYLASSHDLDWHLTTSLGRLLLQIAPAALALAWAVLPGVSGYSSRAA